MTTSDVVVIGGGIIGGTIAWRLARAGAAVTLVERDRLGAEASTAAAGLLVPAAAAGVSPPLLAHWREALRQFPDYVAALEDESALPLDLQTPGRLMVALSDAELARLERIRQLQADAGVPVEWWSADRVRAEEPAVAGEVRAGLRFPEHGLVDTRRLMAALATALSRSGVVVRTGRPVTGLLVERDRVVGVDVCGEALAAGAVVNAAGAWSGSVDRRFSLPVGPAKGQILALEVHPPPLRQIITSAMGGSVAPRADGRVFVAATIEDAGFDRQITAGGMRDLLDLMLRHIPGLVAAPIVETRVGHRPLAADGLPVIGGGTVSGLYYATGHFTMGILSAPATAEAVAGLILDGCSPIPIDAFSPERFAVPGWVAGDHCDEV